MPKDSIAEKKIKHNNFFVYINFCAELLRLANTLWRAAAIFGALGASCHPSDFLFPKLATHFHLNFSH